MGTMITARLKGGLCNQMFQLAAALGAANDHNKDLVIDFNITHHSGQGHPHKKYEDNLYKNIPRGAFKESKFVMYNEPHFHYAPIPNCSGNMLLDGYFQSEKYFNKHRDDVIKLFHFSDEIKEAITSRINKIKNHFNKEETVCIHVRRGEYLKLPTIHTVQPKEFFLSSMKQFDKDKTVFIVISDDMKWCMENLNEPNTAFCNTGYDYDTQPVTSGFPELYDLYLASQCNHNIISNSSFGWWGAWLNENDNKVIAPKNWFGPDGPQDFYDIYCNGWKKK